VRTIISKGVGTIISKGVGKIISKGVGTIISKGLGTIISNLSAANECAWIARGGQETIAAWRHSIWVGVWDPWIVIW
jgi:hypothetical protein